MKKSNEKECFICLSVAHKPIVVDSKRVVCHENCLKEFQRLKAGKIRTERPCFVCGTIISRPPSILFPRMCCSEECSIKYRSGNMKDINVDLNPTRMENFETRVKVREAHLALEKGEGKAYRKIHGRHTHRIVAEQKIGRALLPGEVVHHIDENILNNDPDNLEVMTNAEHSSLHARQRWERKKNGL